MHAMAVRVSLITEKLLEASRITCESLAMHSRWYAKDARIDGEIILLGLSPFLRAKRIIRTLPVISREIN